MNERAILLKFIEVAGLFKPKSEDVQQKTQELYELIEVVRKKLRDLDKERHPTGHGEQGW